MSHSSTLVDCCITGIDPGTETLGYAELWINPINYDITTIISYTFYGSKLPNYNENVIILNSERFSKCNSHYNNLLNKFINTRPIAIACESPFYNSRRPTAFGALTEVVVAIRRAVVDYNPWLELRLVDPPNVKKTIGAKGNADKIGVKEAFIINKEIMAKISKPIELISEHEIDAICIAYNRYKELLNSSCMTA